MSMIGLIVLVGIATLCRIALKGSAFWSWWPLVSVLAAILAALLTIGSPAADAWQHASGGFVGVFLFGLPAYAVCLLIARGRANRGA